MALFFVQLAEDLTCNLRAAILRAVSASSGTQGLLLAQVPECGWNTWSSVQDTDADIQNPESTLCNVLRDSYA